MRSYLLGRGCIGSYLHFRKQTLANTYASDIERPNNISRAH